MKQLPSRKTKEQKRPLSPRWIIFSVRRVGRVGRIHMRHACAERRHFLECSVDACARFFVARRSRRNHRAAEWAEWANVTLVTSPRALSSGLSPGDRSTFITLVFRPETCFRFAQLPARPGIKNSLQERGRRVGRGGSVSQHVGGDRSPACGGRTLAELSSAVDACMRATRGCRGDETVTPRRAKSRRIAIRRLGADFRSPRSDHAALARAGQ